MKLKLFNVWVIYQMLILLNIQCCHFFLSWRVFERVLIYVPYTCEDIVPVLSDTMQYYTILAITGSVAEWSECQI